MDSSYSSPPLHAYLGASSSLDRVNRSSTTRTTAPWYRANVDRSDIELRLLRVIGRNRVQIVQADELEESSLHNVDAVSRSGFAMQVTEGMWKGRAVALKRIKHTYNLVDDQDSDANAQTLRQYEKSMEDISYEVQIMSKQSLKNHRNIVKLFGVTFPDGNRSQAINELILPTLVMELADTRFPDLSIFFDRNENPFLTDTPSFQLVAGLIADIADGLAALHCHDIVHADLKPKNILIFSDDASPNGFIAKLSDFGFSGMTTYTSRGERAWHGDGGRTRGGTAEWSAPECFGSGVLPALASYEYREEDRYRSPIDLYSYGLVLSYVGLCGRSPRSFIDNLDDAKLNDEVVGIISHKLESYYNDFNGTERCLGDILVGIVEQTLRFDPGRRSLDLRSVRKRLFGSNPYETQYPPTEVFVLNFELFPKTAQEFHRDGLYNAYWTAPAAFRRRVYQSFIDLTSGPFGQYIPQEVFSCLTEKDNSVPEARAV